MHSGAQARAMLRCRQLERQHAGSACSVDVWRARDERHWPERHRDLAALEGEALYHTAMLPELFKLPPGWPCNLAPKEPVHALKVLSPKRLCSRGPQPALQSCALDNMLQHDQCST